MNKSAKTIILAASVFTVFAFTGCKAKNQKSAQTEEKKEAEIIYAVSTNKTVKGNLDDYLEFGGDVASVNEVMVLPDQAGKITNVLVKVGDMVKKDQVIAYVNPLRAGVVYNDSPVKAPISGRVTSLPVTVGSTVGAVVIVGFEVGVFVTVGFCVTDGLGVFVDVGLEVLVGVLVTGIDVGLLVAVGVAVSLGVEVAVGVDVGISVGVTVIAPLKSTSNTSAMPFLSLSSVSFSAIFLAVTV